MKIEIPKQSKILIIEGIPGAGKTTLHNKLIENLSGKVIYDFHEEELLCSWKHAWLKNIDQMRIELMQNILEYAEKNINENENSVFILSRFHITYYLYAEKNVENDKEYLDILNKLKKLSAYIYAPLVSLEEIEKRASHSERQDPIWQQHLNKRLAQKGFNNLTEMYNVEQIKIKEILKTQEIPYSLINIETPNQK